MHTAVGKPVHCSPIGSSFRFSPLRRTGNGLVKTLDFRRKLGDWNYRGIRVRFCWEQGARIVADFNTGAGYIGGATAFLALWCRGKSGVDMYRRIPIQVGFTQNARVVPHEY